MRRGPALAYPRAAERRYRAYLLKRVRRLIRLIRKALRSDVRSDDVQVETGFDSGQLLARLAVLSSIVAEDKDSGFEGVLRAVQVSTNRSASRVLAQLGATSVGVPVQVPTSWADTNLELIKDIDRGILERMSEAIIETSRKGGSMRDLEKRLSDISLIGKNRAKLIARNEVGNLNATVSRQRQVDVGIVEYIWRTSEDERVRPLHRDLNNKPFRWDTGHPQEGHPGEAINCRCVAIPVIPEQ